MTVLDQRPAGVEERTPHATGSLADRPSGSKVGLELPHEAANLHVTGAALYTDDLIMRTSGVLHAWPVQAPHARALITDLRVKPAYDIDGVVRVLTAEDVPGVNDAGIKHDEPLFPSEVMFHGHAICWVLGETLDAARRGAEAIEVDYEPLPSLMTLTEAIEQESFQGHQRTVSRGDAAAGLAEAAHRFTGEFEFGGQEHFYLETHCSLALVDENGQIFVQCSTQHPSETQEIVAHVLGLDSHAVTVQCLRMGGGFGGKEMQPHGFAAIAALGATLTGRPVRLRLNRTQDMTMSGKRHPFHASWEIGFDDDGLITGLQATLTSDGGWSLDLSEPVLARALCHIDNAYWIPNIEAHGRIAKTNKTSQTAFRGFGGPQGMIVIEDILGRCAPLLGLPAEELRRRNLYRAGQSTPYGQPVRHPERLADIWSQLLDKADYTTRLAALEAFNAEHQHTKRGLAITPVKFGISFNLTAFNQAGALVHVYKDGSVLINHGGTEMGQGLHTKMIQVAATALGVPLSAVRLAPTRTDKVPNTSATAASSGADLNGGAIKNACDQIRDRLAEVAARKLNIHPADVRFHDGVVTGIGFHDREISFAELAHAAYFQRVSLWAAGFYRTEGLHWDAERMQGEPFKYFAYGAALAEVEVDGFTGAYRFLRTDIVHDAGDSLSPLIDVGQIEGGFVQGAGWLTLEQLRWDTGDGPNRGRLNTQAASTYKLPSFSEMPEVFHVHLYEKATESGVVYGSKAVGEPPLMLAFCVREALRQAAASFGPPGTSVDLASPATPEAVYWALDAARSGVSTGDLIMDWLRAATELRDTGQPGVLITVTAVRGHAPRDPGAKMVVGPARTWGSIGGGNLEEVAITRARTMITESSTQVDTVTTRLNPHERTEFGRQCCGGEVTVLFEPLPARPTIAIFGVGHVGYEIARIVSRWDVRLLLVDSRAEELEALRLVDIVDGTADVEVHRTVLGETVLERLPVGSHVLIMTHDHAEDFALCDAALRLPAGQLADVGLIGSSAKWARFRANLAEHGHDADRIAGITCPIGLPAIAGKEPAVIAVSVAAALMQAVQSPVGATS